MSKTIFRLFNALCLCCIGLSWPGCLQAGGMEDGSLIDDTALAGPAYFGFVRDERGSSVARASVSLQPKEGQAIVVQANILGVYRSHVSPTVKPDDVLISCSKPGYKYIRTVKRPTSTSRMIETDCLMQKN
jgi:hypothetical protein